MAALIAVANSHAGGLSGDALKVAVADGIQIAFWLAAAGVAVSLVFVMALPKKPA